MGPTQSSTAPRNREDTTFSAAFTPVMSSQRTVCPLMASPVTLPVTALPLPAAGAVTESWTPVPPAAAATAEGEAVLEAAAGAAGDAAGRVPVEAGA